MKKLLSIILIIFVIPLTLSQAVLATGERGVTDKTDTVQTTTVGVTDKTDTVQPTAGGVTDKSDTVQPTTVGVTDKTDTVQPTTVGVTDKTDTLQPTTVGATDKTDTVQPTTVGVTDKTDTLQPTAGGVTDKTDTLQATTVGVTDKTDTGALSPSDRGEQIKEYIKEKILPVIVGVITSISALLATLGGIFKALSSLKGTNDLLKEDSEKRKSAYNELCAQIISLKAEIEKCTELDAKITALKNELEAVIRKSDSALKIMELGFLESSDIVKSDKGREIVQIVKEANGEGECA